MHGGGTASLHDDPQQGAIEASEVASTASASVGGATAHDVKQALGQTLTGMRPLRKEMLEDDEPETHGRKDMVEVDEGKLKEKLKELKAQKKMEALEKRKAKGKGKGRGKGGDGNEKPKREKTDEVWFLIYIYIYNIFIF